MPTKKSSTSKKKKNVAPAAETKIAQDTANTYKTWRIEKLEDVALVDDCQMDKVLYFLSHALRKCKIQQLKLVAFCYSEKGAVELETEPLEEKEDPLA